MTRPLVALLLVSCATETAPDAPLPDVAEVTEDVETVDASEEVDPPTIGAVGFVERTIDGADGVSLHTIVWYPAAKAKANVEPKVWFGIVQGEAQAELDAAPGDWPVILFSHGSQAINFQSVDVVEAWARAGWVVAAPNHVFNTLADNDKDKLGDVGIRRPKDLVAALTLLETLDAEAGGVLEGRIDTERFAVAGHSFGAFTALVVAGASIDVEGALARCAAGDDLKGACPMVETLEGPLYDGRPAALDGVQAAIAMSPAVWGLFAEPGLATVDTPVFIAAGAKDTITPTDIHAEPIFAALPPPKAIARFAKAGHYAFSNFCDIPDIEEVTAGVIAECDDTFIEWHHAMALIAEQTLPWLEAHVLDDPDALTLLQPDTWAPDATVELELE